ncbi:hypothetical protein [Flammeovirga aprica]|uniref:Uncharacterized protein n=1 Tax=Flammeovirga aprica JL-4 TaxID=694437 RepID=A0A7X9S240_9BACT|nr:hypothetical protein [Flammeovirga aprica]NME72757.1 hypothetical protein [Flammeovirga aprica JL-4]
MDKKCKSIDAGMNRRIRESLEKYKKIDSPALCLFPIDNIYGIPPYFAFRFNNGVLDDYLKLENIIKNYDGELKWTMSTKEGRKNWLIEPEVFKSIRNDYESSQKDSIIKIIGDKYYEYCDKAVNDIEPLCNLIKEKFLP